METAEFMRNTYYTSNEKTALAITIANRERALLADIDYKMAICLYVGIPCFAQVFASIVRLALIL